MRADLFVVLAHVPLDKNGGVVGFTYGGSTWKMRVDDSTRSLIDRVYTHPKEDWDHIVTRVGHEVLNEMTPLIEPSVFKTNTAILQHLCKRLGVTIQFGVDEPTPLRGVDRLIYLCRRYKADTFVAQDGVPVDVAQFKAAQINVETYTPEHIDNVHVFDVL